jgi:CubicO group peptidase (beta-lactamase class C family)
LVKDGRLGLNSALGDVWSPAVGSPYVATPIWELLAHMSGSPADMDLTSQTGSTAEELYMLVLSQPRTHRRPQYSDCGYILLGGLIEYLTSRSLAQHVADISYLELAPPTEATVATENCPWRGAIMCGEPHDEKAYVFPDKVAGHAGVFASLPQVGDFVQALLGSSGVGELLIDVATRPWTPHDHHHRFGLGFRLPAKDRIGGSLRSRTGYGATGFVGNQLWVEPDRGYGVVVLSNHVHPRRTSRGPHEAWCSRLMDAVALSIR